MSANILDEISEILSGVEKYWINEKLDKTNNNRRFT